MISCNVIYGVLILDHFLPAIFCYIFIDLKQQITVNSGEDPLYFICFDVSEKAEQELNKIVSFALLLSRLSSFLF